MMRWRHCAAAVAAVMAAPGALAQATGDQGASNGIPGVPVSVTDPRSGSAVAADAEGDTGSAAPAAESGGPEADGAPPPAEQDQAVQAARASGPDTEASAAKDRRELTVEPGANQLMVISQGHPNRIIAPWPDPEVRSAHEAEIEVVGRVIYVTTAQSAPITLYVTDGHNEQRALSLTLVPRRVPPREYSVSIAGMESMASMVQPDKAGTWERSNPLRASVTKALSQAAKGELPAGYGMQDGVSPDAMPIHCDWDGSEDIQMGTGQRLEGRNLIVWVAPLHNGSDEPIEVRGPECYHRGILAVSSYPRAALKPGEETELYLVERRAGTPSGNERPSVLGRGAPEEGEDD
ncbi:conjugal transfer pilus assembly protein TraK [Thiohalospira halophila DSM 15071]|uniref:Conjugal transfer pilus assembly protein TraK n=1 Tax=Thiohalospira halophila DSM 15071 TaxID=1123397 RepID=A0A1I1N1L5_9GAMM|nr:type-F conjugative transfer system secretin TraK [Thiohalospira halophila]SFC91509.1 conjugal transfer pilus assembly protein TraK [Thiohalospira halophila DSM 15071]